VASSVEEQLGGGVGVGATVEPTARSWTDSNRVASVCDEGADSSPSSVPWMKR
jgi:hypothetical protein